MFGLVTSPGGSREDVGAVFVIPIRPATVEIMRVRHGLVPDPAWELPAEHDIVGTVATGVGKLETEFEVVAGELLLRIQPGVLPARGAFGDL